MQPLALALGAGVLIILLRLPLIDLALHIVGGSEAVLEQARRFLEIRWLSAPPRWPNPVLLGWLLGVQYARAPVILLVVGNLLNIVLDLWLVMGLRMNVQGAALATVTAEYATLIIGLLMAKRVLTLRGVSLAMLKKRLARGSAPFIGVESGHHAALSAAAAVLWRTDRVRRPSGQRHCGG